MLLLIIGAGVSPLFYFNYFAKVNFPLSLEDEPYMKKFLILQDCKKHNYLTDNIINYIGTNKLPKEFNVEKKPIWTSAFNLSPLTSPIISREIMNVWNNRKDLFAPIGKHYDPSQDIFGEKWLSYHIIKKSAYGKDAQKLLPNTIKAIKGINGFFNWALISVLKPGTHIPPHHGKYNFKLTGHVGYEGIEGCKMRVEDNWINWQEPFVFNDYCEHEVIHGGDKYRIVLILDLINPLLSAQDKKALQIYSGYLEE